SFFPSRRRHTRCLSDWSSDVCSSDLYSLVVVIIGGMGSLGGAAIGSLLLGLTSNFSAAYLPSNYTYYSIIFTFVLVAVVLAVRRSEERRVGKGGRSARSGRDTRSTFC